ncbi:MAG: polysaccharide deacetylase family protein [Clostridia bacterium]|nr:polysaccharide deacetylase family protein [Clostridia bacterium]
MYAIPLIRVPRLLERNRTSFPYHNISIITSFDTIVKPFFTILSHYKILDRPHKKIQLENTDCMYKFRLKKLLSVFLCALLLTACNQAPPRATSSFNKYLPPSFDDFSENLEAITSSESKNASPSTSDDIWDVSDVDISYVDSTKKLISFTFDDTPARTLENILSVFAAFNETHESCRATATLFVNSSRLDNQSMHLLHTASALGFELGNHTHSHFDLTALDETELKTEIEKTDKLLFGIDRKPVHLLRAPFGKTDERIKRISKAPIIDWTIDTLDWTGIDENAVYEQVFSAKRDGSIVLMHDGYPATVSALKRLLPDLANSGYQVVSVSAMAKAHSCPLRKGRVYIRARKQKVK